MRNRALYIKMFPLVDIPTYSYDDVRRTKYEKNKLKSAETWSWFKQSFIKSIYMYILFSFFVAAFSGNLLLILPMMIFYAVLHCLHCPVHKWYLKVSIKDAERILRYNLCKEQLENENAGNSQKNKQILLFCGTILED